MRYEDKVRIQHIIEEAKNTGVMTAKLECFPLRTHALRQDTQKDKTKRKFLDQWIKGVNQHGGFGKWSWAVSKNPGDVEEIINFSLDIN